MIIDKLENAARYFSLNPGIRAAFEFLKRTDINTLEPGKVTIDKDKLFLNIGSSEMKKKEEALLEVHNRYIDIQIPLRCEIGEENFGWSPRCALNAPLEEFSTERDIQFFKDEPQLRFPLPLGCFAIFFPEDAHSPLIGQGSVTKAIFKVASR